MLKNFVALGILLLSASMSIAQKLQMSGGNAYSVTLSESGDVYTYGVNVNGQLGRSTGSLQFTSIPGKVNFTEPMKAVNAGAGEHALALSCTGEVWAWGSGRSGQLGNGINSMSADCDVESPLIYGVRTGVLYPAADCITPVKVCAGQTNMANPMSPLTGIVAISGGSISSYAITSDHKLVAWGDNSYGQLGSDSTGWKFSSDYTPTTIAKAQESSLPVYVINRETGLPLTNVIAVDAGDYHAYALVNDDNDGDPTTGRVYAWGGAYNIINYVIGNSTYPHASNSAVLVQDKNGDALTDIHIIAAGDAQGYFVQKSTGRLYSAGSNYEGLRGNGTDDFSLPYATLVKSGDMFRYSSDTLLANVISISSGQAFAIATVNVNGIGHIMTWGRYESFSIFGHPDNGGHLGLGKNTIYNPSETMPRFVTFSNGDTLKNAVTVSAGDGVSYCLTIDPATNMKQTYVWGSNKEGQLGLGSGTTEDVTYHDYPVEFSLPSFSVAGVCTNQGFAQDTIYANNFPFLIEYPSLTNMPISGYKSPDGRIMAYQSSGINIFTYGRYVLQYESLNGACTICTGKHDTLVVSPAFPPSCNTVEPSTVSFALGQANICQGDSTTVTVSAQASIDSDIEKVAYTWYYWDGQTYGTETAVGHSGTFAADGTTETFKIAKEGKYIVKYHDTDYLYSNVCRTADTIKLSYSKPNIVFQLASEVCENGSFDLSHGVNLQGGTFSAVPALTIPSTGIIDATEMTARVDYTFRYVYTDSIGCKDSAQAIMANGYAPSITDVTDYSAIGVTTPTVTGSISAKATDGGVIHWVSPDGTALPAFEGMETITVTHSAVVSSTYTYKAYQTIGNCTSDSVDVRFSVSPCQAVVPTVTDNYFCASSLDKSIVATPQSDEYTCGWAAATPTFTTFRGKQSTDPLITMGNKFTLANSTPGTYSFYVASINAEEGCWSLMKMVTFNVVAEPTATMSVSDDSACYSSAVPIDVTLTPAPRTSGMYGIYSLDGVYSTTYEIIPSTYPTGAVLNLEYYVIKQITPYGFSPQRSCESSVVNKNVTIEYVAPPVVSEKDAIYGQFPYPKLEATGDLADGDFNWYSGDGVQLFQKGGSTYDITAGKTFNGYTVFRAAASQVSNTGCESAKTATRLIIENGLPVAEPLSQLRSLSKTISGGSAHTIMLSSDGDVFSFGYNVMSQLGRDIVGDYTSIPGKVNIPAKIIAIDAGSGMHNLALDSKGYLWSWGAGAYGQLGDGINSLVAARDPALNGSSTADRSVPVKVLAGMTNPTDPLEPLKGIIGFSTGNHNSYAITADKNLIAWGDNSLNQLGTDKKGWKFTADYTPSGTGNDAVGESSLPVFVISDVTKKPLANVIDVDAGDNHAYALVDDDNDNDPTTGRVYAWGASQWGNPVISGLNAPDASALATLVVDSQGRPLTGINIITAGDAHGYFVQKNTGYVYSIGSDVGGMRGVSLTFDLENYAMLVSSGEQRTFTGDVYLDKVTSIAGGQVHGIAAVDVNGVGYLMTWGKTQHYDMGTVRSGEGQLGLGQLTAMGVETPRFVKFPNGEYVKNVIGVAAGDGVSYVITEDPVTFSKQIYVFGENANGQLGLGIPPLGLEDYTNRYYPTAFVLPFPSLYEPCPIAELGVREESYCPGFNHQLTAGTTNPAMQYKWYVKNPGSDLYSELTQMAGQNTLLANSFGSYMVEVTSSLTGSSVQCPVARDTIDFVANASLFDTIYTSFDGTDAVFKLNADPQVLDYTFYNAPTAGKVLGKGTRTGNLIELPIAVVNAFDKSYAESGVADQIYSVWIEDKTLPAPAIAQTCGRQEVSVFRQKQPCNGIDAGSFVATVSDDTVCSGTNISLSFDATALAISDASKIRYNWSYLSDADVTVDLNTSGKLTDMNKGLSLVASQSGSYIVSLYDSVYPTDAECHFMDTIHVKVLDKPTYSFSADQTICEGEKFADVQLAIAGTGPWSVQLSNGAMLNTGTISQLSDTLILPIDTAGVISILSLTDKYCSADINGSSKTVLVKNMLPIINLNPTYELCSGVSGYNLSNLFQITNATYTATGDWTTEDGIATIPTLADSAKYEIIATNTDAVTECTNRDTTVLDVLPNTELSISFTTSTCELDSINLPSAVNVAGGVFSIDPILPISNTGNVSTANMIRGIDYTVSYKYVHPTSSCASAQSAQVSYGKAPAISFSKDFRAIAKGSEVVTAQLIAHATKGAVINWISPDGLPMTAMQGLDTITVSVMPMSVAVTYVYRAYQTIGDCVSDTIDVYLSFVPCPALPVTVRDTAFCAINGLKRMSAPQVSANEEIHWFNSIDKPYITRDDMPIEVGNTYNFLNIVPGNYTQFVAVYDNDNQCWSQPTSFNVDLLETPSASLSLSSKSACASDTTAVEIALLPAMGQNYVYDLYIGGVKSDLPSVRPSDFPLGGKVPVAYTVSTTSLGTTCTSEVSRDTLTIEYFESPTVDNKFTYVNANSIPNMSAWGGDNSNTYRWYLPMGHLFRKVAIIAILRPKHYIRQIRRLFAMLPIHLCLDVKVPKPKEHLMSGHVRLQRLSLTRYCQSANKILALKASASIFQKKAMPM